MSTTDFSTEQPQPPGPAVDGVDDEPTGRHPVVVGHLVMGVAFLGLLLVWALIASDTIPGDDVGFLLPVPWVLAGVAGLAALVAADRDRLRRHRTRGHTQRLDQTTDATPPGAGTMGQ